MNQKFVFHIHSNIFEPSNFGDTNIKSFTKTINSIFEVARHLEADVFYLQKDIEELKDYFLTFDENFTKSQANRLDVLLEDFKKSKTNSHLFFVDFSNGQASLRPANYPFINTQFFDFQNIVFNIIYENNEHLLFVNSNTDFQKIKINHFGSSKSIWDFINKTLPQRNYSFSPKHGNNANRAISPARASVSQLLCSDDKAQNLLNSAIFDNREDKFHYNFDSDFDTFIIFPFEGKTPQNQFHAFHIEQSEWDKEIPKSIRDYFGK